MPLFVFPGLSFVIFLSHAESNWLRFDVGRPFPFDQVGHFRVHLSLHFKARLSAKSLLWKSVFIHIEIGTNDHNKNFALRLALKERLTRIREWPIQILFKFREISPEKVTSRRENLYSLTRIMCFKIALSKWNWSEGCEYFSTGLWRVQSDSTSTVRQTKQHRGAVRTKGIHETDSRKA